MQNRHKDEIMRDILYIAQGGAGITKIMFHAYLTHNQSREYIEILIKKGLLELDVDSCSLKHYCTTSKGVEYLSMMERMSDLLSIHTRRAAKSRSYLF
jgi:predicted transcriptional regulator